MDVERSAAGCHSGLFLSRRNLRLSIIKCINVIKSQIDTWSIEKSRIS